ncbi:uncharacterized protein LOC116247703 [Nymphaea colorata]|nr:uncharacterized protein LOC116247703 [Nymphaea colorata]XP_031475820.1 uncharacterized protein LOC116247703 [Nymphaea colorata]
MGDHFVLLMDRLITASTLEAAIESRNLSQFPVEVEKSMVDSTPQWLGDSGTGSPATKVVECRICQEEDYDSNMESPCACCGSLKYAHRKCIQRWCNEKGDTVCEICHQPFKPNYTAPPQMFHYGGIPMNFRGSWEISRQDMRNPQFIAMVATDRSFLDSAYDEYSAYNSRSAFCCRTVAVIFMALLILRHGLPILFGGADEYAFTMFVLFLLRTAGILVPVYIMVRALAAFQRRRQRQEVQDIPLTSSEDEI